MSTQSDKAIDNYFADLHSGKEPTAKFVLPSKNKTVNSDFQTVTDFENNATNQKDYEVVMDALARNKTTTSKLLDSSTYSDDGIAEYMRDVESRMSTKVNLSSDIENWSAAEKTSFNNLRENWDAASVTGVKEHLTLLKDYGIDGLANYESIPAILSVLFAAPTGGGSLVAQAATRKAANTALNKTLSKVALAASPTTLKGAAAYGATIGGVDNALQQNVQVKTGARKEYSAVEGGISVTMGAAFGSALFKGVDLWKGRPNKSVISTKKAEADLEATDLKVTVSEEEGIDIFERGLENGTVPNSANDIIVDLGKVIENSPYLPNKTIKRLLETSDSSLRKNVDLLVKDIGGGKETSEEIVDLLLQSVEKGATGEEIRNMVSHRLWKVTTGVTGKLYGKASGILTPYTTFSKTAQSLQKALNYQWNINYKTTEEVVGMDFGEVAQAVTGSLNQEFLEAVQPIAIHELDGKIEDGVNALLIRAVRGAPSGDEAIDKAAKKIQESFKKIGKQLKEKGLIDHEIDNYFPRMWDRKAIDNNQDELAKIFVEQGEAKNLDEGYRIIEEMLDKENQLSSGTAGHFFSASRAFDNITDDSKVNKFLNQDLRGIVLDYNFQAGKSIAKKDVLGVTNERGFIKDFINPIAEEMRQAGKTMSVGEKKDIIDLYRTTTGENLERFGEGAQNAADAYTLLTRTALLGGVTISSLTEIMINLGKAGLMNTVKGFKEAREQTFKNVTNDLHTKLKNNHNLTAAEAHREMQSMVGAMDQSAAQIGQNRIGGGELANETMQNLNNKFFRLTMLDQWTKFVQRTSFATAKNFIGENLEAISKHGNLEPSRKIKSMLGELKELGIDPEKAKVWFEAGSKTDDPFYQTILRGSARYTNQVILQPTGMAGNKPLLHAKPKTTMLFQLMGYPAAFTNTVLKGAAQKISQDPARNVGKIAVTALLMTETARMTNWMRSRGESEEDKTLWESHMSAIARWGGFGLAADQGVKAKRAVKYGPVSSALVTSTLGPVAGDVQNVFTKGIAQTVGAKVPLHALGNTVLGKDSMKKYSKMLREMDKDLKDALSLEDYKAPERFNKGGEVDIPNAPAEPDERINKITGLPYNYQAGSAYMDEDDPRKVERQGFNIGTLVSRNITKAATKAFSPKSDVGFFSKAEKKAMSLTSKKNSGSQYIAELKKAGVTEDELEFTGFNAEFAENPKVTKDQVVSYLNRNRLDVTESVGYLPDRKGIDEAEKGRMGEVFDDVPEDPINQVRTKMQQVQDQIDDLTEIEETRPLTPEEDDLLTQLSLDLELLDSDYAMITEDPFGEFRGSDIPDPMLVEGSDFNPQLIHKDYSWNGLDTVNYREVTLKVPNDRSGIEAPFSPYTTPHFEGQENVIAHIRFGDIFSPDPQDKILLIDEGQSDFWQQKSRYGKRDKEKFPDYKDQIQDSINKREVYYDKLKKELEEAKAEEQSYNKVTNSAAEIAQIKDIKETQVKLEKEIDDLNEQAESGTLSDEQEIEIYEKLEYLDLDFEGNNQMLEDLTTDLNVQVPDEVLKKIRDLENKFEEATEEIVDLTASLDQNYISKFGPTPNMPFMPRKSTGVTKLTMSRALIEAAKGDYNTVVFTTAQQQMDRYKISGDKGKSFIDKYDKDIPKFFTEFLKKYDQELVMKPVYKQGEGEKKTLVEVPSFKITEQMREDISRGLTGFNEGGIVKIKKGDTLSAIARRNNTSVASLAKLNRIKDVDKIYAGLTLQLPKETNIRPKESLKPRVISPEIIKPAVVAEPIVRSKPTTVSESFNEGFGKASSLVSQAAEDTAQALRGIKKANAPTEVDISDTPDFGAAASGAFEKAKNYFTSDSTAPKVETGKQFDISMPDISGITSAVKDTASGAVSSTRNNISKGFESMTAPDTSSADTEAALKRGAAQIGEAVSGATSRTLNALKGIRSKLSVDVDGIRSAVGTQQPDLSEMPDLAGGVKSLLSGGRGRTADNTKGSLRTSESELSMPELDVEGIREAIASPDPDLSNTPKAIRNIQRELVAGVNIIPENALLYVRYMLGNKLGLDAQGSDVRVERFGTKQQDVLKATIENAIKGGRTSIKYSDYPDMKNGERPDQFYKAKRNKQSYVDLAVTSLKDPVFEMFTTTGVFNFRNLGEGKYEILPDKYDFDKSKSGGNNRKEAIDNYGKLTHAAQDISADPSKRYTFNVRGVLI